MNERPDTEQIKAQLATAILDFARELGLSDEAASRRLGIAQAEFAQLRDPTLARFSVDELIGFLNSFDRRVAVAISSAADRDAPSSLLEVVAAVTASIPDEEWAKLPTDLAENHDRYLYGVPAPD